MSTFDCCKVFIIIFISVLISGIDCIFNLEKFEAMNVNNNSVGDFSMIMLEKSKNSDPSIRGKAKLLADIGDETKMELVVYRLQKNEYRQKLKTPKRKMCTWLKKYKKEYESFRRNTTIPEGCPIPWGNYEIMITPDSKAESPIEGDFKAKATFFRNGEEVGGFVMYFELIK